MLDFRRRSRRAVMHAGVPVERRLLSMLIGLALVVMLIASAGNPGNWKWFAPEGPPAAPLQRIARPADNVVVAVADEDTVNGAPQDKRVPGDRPTNTTDDANGPSESDEKRFPGVRTDYLATIRDDTVFRSEESLAWFHLFSVLESTPQDEIVRASEGPVGYLQLNEQPNEYRGRLITIGGTVRAAKLVAAPKNGFDIKEYYQLWLQPDRATDELVVLYCLELPADFPIGDQLDEACTATGFFYKRWAYASQGGITTAPLVVAKTLRWQPKPPVAPAVEQPVSERVLTATIVAAALAAIALVFMIWRVRGASGNSPGAAKNDAAQVSAALASLDQQPKDTNRTG
jgi:hypothetical protein